MARSDNHFVCIKYFLLASNAFGMMLGIFVVLFGLAYSMETFPGGYKGRTCAIISVVFIFFALIGYCGAHLNKIIFLLIYSFIIFIFVIFNALIWIISPQDSILDSHSNTVIIMGLLFIALMCAALVLSWHLKYADQFNEGQELNEKSFINSAYPLTLQTLQRLSTRSFSGSLY